MKDSKRYTMQEQKDMAGYGLRPVIGFSATEQLMKVYTDSKSGTKSKPKQEAPSERLKR